MLILSRHKNKRIMIGEGDERITITVIDIREDKVRLGIEAPRSVPVHREEVYELIRGERGSENHEEL